LGLEWRDAATLERARRCFERGVASGRAEPSPDSDEDEPDVEGRTAHGDDRGCRWVWRELDWFDF